MSKSDTAFVLANVWAIPGLLIGYGWTLWFSWAMVAVYFIAWAILSATGPNRGVAK